MSDETQPTGELKREETDQPYWAVHSTPESNYPLASFVCEHWAREWRHKYCRTGDIRIEMRRLSDLTESELQELTIYNHDEPGSGMRGSQTPTDDDGTRVDSSRTSLPGNSVPAQAETSSTLADGRDTERARISLWRVQGFLEGLAGDLKSLAPSKAELCIDFAKACENSARGLSTTEKEKKEIL